jgi:hypothetical protein
MVNIFKSEDMRKYIKSINVNEYEALKKEVDQKIFT